MYVCMYVCMYVQPCTVHSGHFKIEPGHSSSSGTILLSEALEVKTSKPDLSKPSWDLHKHIINKIIPMGNVGK